MAILAFFFGIAFGLGGFFAYIVVFRTNKVTPRRRTLFTTVRRGLDEAHAAALAAGFEGIAVRIDVLRQGEADHILQTFASASLFAKEIGRVAALQVSEDEAVAEDVRAPMRAAEFNAHTLVLTFVYDDPVINAMEVRD